MKGNSFCTLHQSLRKNEIQIKVFLFLVQKQPKLEGLCATYKVPSDITKSTMEQQQYIKLPNPFCIDKWYIVAQSVN